MATRQELEIGLLLAHFLFQKQGCSVQNDPKFQDASSQQVTQEHITLGTMGQHESPAGPQKNLVSPRKMASLTSPTFPARSPDRKEELITSGPTLHRSFAKGVGGRPQQVKGAKADWNRGKNLRMVVLPRNGLH